MDWTWLWPRKSPASRRLVIVLEPGDVLPLAGDAVDVLEGRIWVTREGDGRDYIVQSGGRLVLPGSRHAHVQAVGPARIRVDAAFV